MSLPHIPVRFGRRVALSFFVVVLAVAAPHGGTQPPVAPATALADPFPNFDIRDYKTDPRLADVAGLAAYMDAVGKAPATAGRHLRRHPGRGGVTAQRAARGSVAGGRPWRCGGRECHARHALPDRTGRRPRGHAAGLPERKPGRLWTGGRTGRRARRRRRPDEPGRQHGVGGARAADQRHSRVPGPAARRVHAEGRAGAHQRAAGHRRRRRAAVVAGPLCRAGGGDRRRHRRTSGHGGDAARARAPRRPGRLRAGSDGRRAAGVARVLPPGARSGAPGVGHAKCWAIRSPSSRSWTPRPARCCSARTSPTSRRSRPPTTSTPATARPRRRRRRPCPAPATSRRS